MITILGPTATGKTALAVALAKQLGNTEIISADSRQVYRGMNLGTGKDLEEYENIPYHLIDIKDPGYEYNVFEYQQDFQKVYEQIIFRGVNPILCGGTGMYIEAVLKGYKFIQVPPNPELRASLEEQGLETLIKRLEAYKELHNSTDTTSKKRVIRAIEIEEGYEAANPQDIAFPKIPAQIFGIDPGRTVVRERIQKRLEARINAGMIEEVKTLISQGTSPEKLIFYGLEYKFLTQHILGEITREQLLEQLNIAIRQFAKRQMTWYRRMEKHGLKIHWLDGKRTTKELVDIITNSI